MTLNRVLIVSPMWPSDSQKSFGVFVRNVAQGLAKFENRVELAVIKGRGLTVWGKLFKHVVMLVDVWCYLFKKKVDVIYLHSPNWTFPFIYLAGKLFSVPVVVNFHGNDLAPINWGAKTAYYINSKFYFKVKYFVVPSYHFKSVLEGEVACELANIYVSPSGGVDAQIFNSHGRLARSKNSFRLGFVGRIDPGKGWQEFIWFVKNLRQRGYSVDAEMVGSGSQSNDLLEFIKDDDLGINYCFGVSQSELAEHYKSYDLFLFLSVLNESLGLVPIESLMCGTPVFAYKNAAMPEYIKCGVNGELFELGDKWSILNAVSRYIDNREIFENYTREAVAVSSKYSNDKCNYLLSEFLRSVSNKSHQA